MAKSTRSAVRKAAQTPGRSTPPITRSATQKIKAASEQTPATVRRGRHRKCGGEFCELTEKYQHDRDQWNQIVSDLEKKSKVNFNLFSTCLATTLRNWSDLPDGLLHTILTCLCSLVDFFSFSVCRSWHAVTSSVSPSWTTSHFPPLLLYPTFTSSNFLSSLRLLDPTTPSFSSPISRNSNKFQLSGSLSGSLYYSHGNLLRFMLLQNHIVILNPLTGDKLSSPLLPQNCKTCYLFPMLISHLSSPDSGVLVFTYDTLYHWHIGSPSWSSHCPRVSGSILRMKTATVQGKVYVMDPQHTLFVLDLSPQLHLRPLAVDGLPKHPFRFQHFVAVCDGELLLLLLVPTNKELRYAQLEVYRLNSSVNGTRWVKQETLGNWAIFVGYDSRVQGLAIQNPERREGETIVFTLQQGIKMVIGLGQ